MKISQKMLLGSTLLVAIPLIISSVVMTTVASNSSKEAISEQVENGLISIRDMQKSRITDYFNLIKEQIITLSNQRLATEAMLGFNQHFANFSNEMRGLDQRQAKQSVEAYYNGPFNDTYKGANHGISANTSNIVNKLDTNTIALQYSYISENSFPLGEKNALNSTNDGSGYSATHALFHREFNEFLTTFGYYDIFLIDMKGNVVYSVYKEVDYATNLESGPFANSGLAKAYKESKNANSAEQFSFVDFAPYQPSYNSPASFISSPIFDGNTQIGIMAFQMPIDKINTIMTMEEKWAEAGLGASGETYIVGGDFKARSISRFLIEDEGGFITALRAGGVTQTVLDNIKDKGTNIGIQEIRTNAVDAGLSGQSSVEIIRDYRGVEVLSAYAPISIMGLQWAILSEIDAAEAFHEVGQLQTTLIINSVIALIALLALGITAGLIFSRSITTPISQLTKTINGIENNSDLTARITHQSKDELGEMSASVNRMLEKFQSSMSQVNVTTERLAASSEELTAVTRETTDAVSRQRSETDQVATAMNEMTATVQEVSSNATNAATAAGEANEQTLEGKRIVSETIDSIQMLSEEITRASEVINKLEHDSEEIGSVLDVIRGIAEQTNLLALNAAIEAARAGEQGRGFAVVADEVRTLASRTQQSTQEIQAMIERLQAGSREAVSAMKEGADQAKVSVEKAGNAGTALEAITYSVGQITDMNTLIATAAEEQSAVADEINANINNISHVADETTSGATQVTSESEQLAQLAVDLKGMVNTFKI